MGKRNSGMIPEDEGIDGGAIMVTAGGLIVRVTVELMQRLMMR